MHRVHESTVVETRTLDSDLQASLLLWPMASTHDTGVGEVADLMGIKTEDFPSSRVVHLAH